VHVPILPKGLGSQTLHQLANKPSFCSDKGHRKGSKSNYMVAGHTGSNHEMTTVKGFLFL
jgi:hypothetical protein